MEQVPLLIMILTMWRSNIDEVLCEDVFASNYNEESLCSYYNTYPIEDETFLNY